MQENGGYVAGLFKKIKFMLTKYNLYDNMIISIERSNNYADSN